MLNKPKRKMGFFEIGNGKLTKELQDEFEQASITAVERNGAVKITLTINVNPPTIDNLGSISYTLKSSAPVRKSVEYEAEYQHGLIVEHAPMDIGVMQERLKFPGEDSEKNIPFPSLEKGAAQ